MVQVIKKIYSGRIEVFYETSLKYSSYALRHYKKKTKNYGDGLATALGNKWVDS